MFDIFKKKDKKKDDGVVVLRKTEPGMCGGTDATQDTKAPKVIESKELTVFDVSTRLNCYPRTEDSEVLGRISAFAAPSGDNTFLFLCKEYGFSRRGNDRDCNWALIKENVLPKLAELIAECDLAKNNGYHATTHGLPENFGGSVDIRYASGEKISFSNNQHSMVSAEAGVKIAEFFDTAMKKERVPLPDASDLVGIRFSEERANGGYTRAIMTINEDGTATNRKTARYDDPTVYESEKTIDAATVEAIKKNINDCAVLAWEHLPESEYKFGADKKMTFVFADGTEITVAEGKRVPNEIHNGFFNIDLEITTKH